jgi:hypothetical protein
MRPNEVSDDKCIAHPSSLFDPGLHHRDQLCYQVRFCTELISTGATYAIQLGFAQIGYPPGQYK